MLRTQPKAAPRGGPVVRAHGAPRGRLWIMVVALGLLAVLAAQAPAAPADGETAAAVPGRG